MRIRVSTCISAVVVLASIATSACESDDATTTASITGPSFVATGIYTPAAFTADPAIVAAQFHPNASCRTHDPFAANVTVIIRAGHALYLNGFRFDYLDSSGRTVVPLVFPGATDANKGIVLPIPPQTTYPIPFPGLVPMSGTRVEAGNVVRAPFRVQFDCGVPLPGTLRVSIESADQSGAASVSRVQAQIQ